MRINSSITIVLTNLDKDTIELVYNANVEKTRYNDGKDWLMKINITPTTDEEVAKELKHISAKSLRNRYYCKNKERLNANRVKQYYAKRDAQRNAKNKLSQVDVL